MAKFQIDPAGPPVKRQAPPPPPPPKPEPDEPEPAAESPAVPDRRRQTIALAVVALLLVAGVATVGVMAALDLGPFAYPERYLLEAEEAPEGLRLQSLPAPLRSEFGIDANPDEIPREKLDEFRDSSGSDADPEEAWIESLGTGRPGELMVIAAARYASEEDAVDAAACDAREGSGVAMRHGKVVVVVLALTDAAGDRVPDVEEALREKARGLVVACRW